MMLMISDIVFNDPHKIKTKNSTGGGDEIFLCNSENLLEKFNDSCPSTLIFSDSFLLNNKAADEALSFVKKVGLDIIIVSSYTSFNYKYIRIDTRIMVVGKFVLAKIIKDDIVSFHINEVRNNKVVKYSQKESRVIESLFSGICIESICEDQSFMKKTLSTHIGNIKIKFGLHSKQQIYYLYLIQKKLNLIQNICTGC